ncbi:MAG: hypothetical protein ACLTZI_04175 [[Eubacterium] siraeum]
MDIEFVTNIAIKVCLDLLNQNQLGYTPRVLNYLTNSTLICNTNNPSIGGETVTMFPHPLFISHTIRMNKKEKTNDERSATDNGVENVEQISTGWNDEKSALIEKQYLEPLMTCSLMIANKISEANEFISMVEKRLEQVDDF